ncbi:Leucine rich repeat N-terminal domain [Seminavis robusta]|uniref:Leucine rich repeat N-terminal domain n=1 Tax=Seminavis robusta TaxID=568900 RepID=A0A9N8HF59_9STRA|nr:Leucine rich repeat N-terminal domain [Seminavis robusta]|eukprot:Sro334_g119730.1 Leucine rich repeat N-terminal domain (822) ;mRNA; f:22437-24988
MGNENEDCDSLVEIDVDMYTPPPEDGGKELVISEDLVDDDEDPGPVLALEEACRRKITETDVDNPSSILDSSNKESSEKQDDLAREKLIASQDVVIRRKAGVVMIDMPANPTNAGRNSDQVNRHTASMMLSRVQVIEAQDATVRRKGGMLSSTTTMSTNGAIDEGGRQGDYIAGEANTFRRGRQVMSSGNTCTVNLPDDILHAVMPMPSSLSRTPGGGSHSRTSTPGAFPVFGPVPGNPRSLARHQRNLETEEGLGGSSTFNVHAEPNVFSSYEVGLVHARQVGQEDIGQAVLMSQDLESQGEAGGKSKSHAKKEVHCYIVVGIGLVLISILVVAVAVAAAGKSNDSAVTSKPQTDATGDSTIDFTSATSNITTIAPTAALVVDLPEYTLKVLREDKEGTAPQSRAYNWLINDKNLESYSAERRLQRFALACFYYATGGEQWLMGGSSSNNHSTNNSASNSQHHGRLLQPSPDGPRPYMKPTEGQQKQGCSDTTPSGKQGPGSDGDPTLPPCRGGARWLDYSAHECTWFHRFSSIEESICDENGAYETIRLVANGLRGTLCPELALLSNLKKILTSDIGGTMIPTEIGAGWQKIEWVMLMGGRGGSLQGTLPSEIGLWSETIERFSVMANNLSGGIPTELFALSRLESLQLLDNRFVGPFFHPELLPNLRALTQLEILENEFDGTIATEIGLVTNLEILSFHFDHGTGLMTGTLPTELGLLTEMYFFSAGNHLLTGQIPSELGLWPLHTLSVKDNPLTGTIPSELASIEIPFVYIQRTELSGTVPSTWCNATVLRFTCSETLCGCDCPCSLGNQTQDSTDP